MASSNRSKQSTQSKEVKIIEATVMRNIKAKFQDKIQEVTAFFEEKYGNIIHFEHNESTQKLSISGLKNDIDSACLDVELITSDKLMHIFSEKKEESIIIWKYVGVHSEFFTELKKDLEELNTAGGNIESQNPVVITCKRENEVRVKLHVLWLCMKIERRNKTRDSNSKQDMPGYDSNRDSFSQKSQTVNSHGSKSLPIKSGPLSKTKKTSDKDQFAFSQNREIKPKLEPTQKYSDFQLHVRTNEGLKICIYSASITNLIVDSIVNAANSMLTHNGGVALAIARKAGPDLEQQCRQIIVKRKQLQVTDNCVTTGGRLPCGHVIHAVGPQWSAYRNKADCLKDLYITVQNILKTAEKKKIHTVAMPAICSGIYGVPKDMCAKMYIKAAMDFSREEIFSHVKELHFVDIGEEILFLIAGAYDGWMVESRSFNPSVVAAMYGTSTSTSSIQQSQKPLQPTMICRELSSVKMNGTPVQVFQFYEKFLVKIYNGDLVKVKDVDAVVCSQDPRLCGTSKLTQAIYQAAGVTLKPSNTKFTYGHVVSSTAGKLLRGGCILHAIVCRVSTSPTRTELSRMTDMVTNILNFGSSQKLKIKRIAMPLLGTGSLKDPRALESCSKAVYTGIVDFAARKRPCHLLELQLVNKNPEVTKILINEFRKMSMLVVPQTKGVPNGSKNREPIYDDIIYFNQENIEQNFDDGFEQIEMNTATQSDWSRNTDEADVSNSQEGSKIVNKNLTDTETQQCLCHNCHANGIVSEMLVLECRHAFCQMCAVPFKDNNICTLCQEIGKPEGHTVNPISSSVQSEPGTNMSSSVQSEPGTVNQGDRLTGSCVICMDDLKKPVRLKQCSHVFCEECIRKAYSHKCICPVCNMVYKKLCGNQPKDGKMTVMKDDISLPGYQQHRTLVINYDFPNGTQEADHPNPGLPYKSINRTAYLPDNSEGNRVLKMLKEAFKQRLTFTIGESRTSGKEDCITWNDIHHKTRRDGGVQRYGYPDPSYLQRVTEELASKGIKKADNM